MAFEACLHIAKTCSEYGRGANLSIRQYCGNLKLTLLPLLEQADDSFGDRQKDGECQCVCTKSAQGTFISEDDKLRARFDDLKKRWD